MRTVLHIGMHKTGSTSIQSYLQHNRESAAKAGISVPDFGGANGRKAQHRLWHLLLEGADNDIKRALLEKTGLRLRIISVENLYQAIPAMVIRLHDLLAEARVICFVRNPADHIASFYRQLVRTKGLDHSLEEFIQRETDALRRGKCSYYALDDRLAMWRASFPDLNTASYVPDILPKFLAMGRLPTPEGAIVPVNANTSISAEATCVLRRLLPMNRQIREFVAAAPERVVRALDGSFRYGNVDFTAFFAAFVDRNPWAMQKHRFKPRPMLRWPTGIDLTDTEIMARIANVEHSSTHLPRDDLRPLLSTWRDHR